MVEKGNCPWQNAPILIIGFLPSTQPTREPSVVGVAYLRILRPIRHWQRKTEQRIEMQRTSLLIWLLISKTQKRLYSWWILLGPVIHRPPAVGQRPKETPRKDEKIHGSFFILGLGRSLLAIMTCVCVARNRTGDYRRDLDEIFATWR